MFIIVLKRKRSLPTRVLLARVAVGVRRRILRVVQVNFESRSGWVGGRVEGVGVGGVFTKPALSDNPAGHNQQSSARR